MLQNSNQLHSNNAYSAQRNGDLSTIKCANYLYYNLFVGMEEQGPLEPKSSGMYEGDREFVLPATPSLMPNNLCVIYFESKFMTYSCYFSRNLVQLVTWDIDMGNVTMETLPLKEIETEKPLNVMQCRIVTPSNRTVPLLIVATASNAMVTRYFIRLKNNCFRYST